MIIFGNIGRIGDLYRASVTETLVNYCQPKNLPPTKLASQLWELINTNAFGISPESQASMLNRVANAVSASSDDLSHLVNLAKSGDAIAQEHIGQLALSYSRQGKPMPEPLVNLFADLLTSSASLAKPRGAPKKVVRDQKIAMLLEVLLKCCPTLKPFRSEIKRIKDEPASSACSIAQEMLQKNRVCLSEKAIESIYSNYCQILK